MNDGGESILWVNGCTLALEPPERFLGVFETALANEMPWRLGGEEEDWNQKDGPYPL